MGRQKLLLCSDGGSGKAGEGEGTAAACSLSSQLWTDDDTNSFRTARKESKWQCHTCSWPSINWDSF